MIIILISFLNKNYSSYGTQLPPARMRERISASLPVSTYLGQMRSAMMDRSL